MPCLARNLGSKTKSEIIGYKFFIFSQIYYYDTQFDRDKSGLLRDIHSVVPPSVPEISLFE